MTLVYGGGLETTMGLIIEFPAMLMRRSDPTPAPRAEPAEVVILPVVRIERHAETPTGGDPGEGPKSRKRRRRARS